MTKYYYFSSPPYTCRVRVVDGVIRGDAAIIRWAYGKSWEWFLDYWTRRAPGQVRTKLLATE